MKQMQYDVVVCGAGVAGVAAAAFLQGHGDSTTKGSWTNTAAPNLHGMNFRNS